MTDELDFDALAKLAAETRIDESWFRTYDNRGKGALLIGNLGEGLSVCRADYVETEDAEKLLMLFRALPRLIELARRGQEVPPVFRYTYTLIEGTYRITPTGVQKVE